ncbi:MAG: peptidoglycan DD-metalloendopeptidase family protein [Muribaculaceae bacterium]
MNLFRTIGLCVGFTAVMCVGGSAFAQNLQSVTNYSSRHDELLARQSHIGEQIRLEETEQFANQLYEECEPEPDIYTEGWESGLVNSYKNAVVPDRATIDVSEFFMPCPGIVTSPYGYRPRFRRMHKGVDLRAAIGDTIYAAFDGKVRLTKYERGGYGYYVIIRHTNGLETVYGHLSKFLVHPDETVKAGTPIALSGNTGRSFGPHLHFETRFMGYAINPAAIFDFENQTVRAEEYTFDKRTFEDAPGYNRSSRSYARKSSSKHKNSYKQGGSKATYKIRQGDNLGKIAARHGTTVAKLCKLNGISKNSKIQAGKVLRVK